MTNFLLIGLCFLAGIVLRKTGKLPEQTPAVLNTFVIYISLPATTLLYVHGLHISTDLLLPASMAWVFFGFAYLIISAACKFFRWDNRIKACLLLTAALGNTSFLGLPMIEAFFGKDGLPVGLIVDQPGSFLALSTLGIITALLYNNSKPSITIIIRRVLWFPPFIALVIACMSMPFAYPAPFTGLLERLASTLSPLALFSVGYQLRVSAFRRLKAPLLIGLAIKMVVVPLIILLVYRAIFSVRGLILDVTIFEAAMPPMITGAVLASDYGHEPELASLMTGAGIVAAFLSLPLWFYILRVLSV